MFDWNFWPDPEYFLINILSICLLLVPTGARKNVHLLINDKMLIFLVMVFYVKVKINCVLIKK